MKLRGLTGSRVQHSKPPPCPNLRRNLRRRLCRNPMSQPSSKPSSPPLSETFVAHFVGCPVQSSKFKVQSSKFKVQGSRFDVRFLLSAFLISAFRPKPVAKRTRNGPLFWLFLATP